MRFAVPPAVQRLSVLGSARRAPRHVLLSDPSPTHGFCSDSIATGAFCDLDQKIPDQEAHAS